MSHYIGCRKDEIFVGNQRTGEDLSYLDNKGIKYRVGEIALDIHGKEIEQWYVRPLFIKKESYDKYNRIMQAQLEAIRRS